MPVHTYMTGFPSNNAVAMEPDGDFVVAWTNDGPGGDDYDMYARRFRWAGQPPSAASVVGRHVFYNKSRRGDGGPADGAVAADKAALLPGQAATFTNVTSYSRGLNGVILDVRGLPAATTTLGVSDYVFRAGTGSDPAAWADAAVPSRVTVSRSAVPEEPARVTPVWPDGAVRNKWLQVTVKANASTGLSAPDVFSFGNLIGETGTRRPRCGSARSTTATGAWTRWTFPSYASRWAAPSRRRRLPPPRSSPNRCRRRSGAAPAAARMSYWSDARRETGPSGG